MVRFGKKVQKNLLKILDKKSSWILWKIKLHKIIISYHTIRFWIFKLKCQRMEYKKLDFWKIRNPTFMRLRGDLFVISLLSYICWVYITIWLLSQPNDIVTKWTIWKLFLLTSSLERQYHMMTTIWNSRMTNQVIMYPVNFLERGWCL